MMFHANLSDVTVRKQPQKSRNPELLPFGACKAADVWAVFLEKTPQKSHLLLHRAPISAACETWVKDALSIWAFRSLYHSQAGLRWQLQPWVNLARTEKSPTTLT